MGGDCSNWHIAAVLAEKVIGYDVDVNLWRQVRVRLTGNGGILDLYMKSELSFRAEGIHLDQFSNLGFRESAEIVTPVDCPWVPWPEGKSL